MPRNVRNFWLEGGAEGIASRHAFGPRSRDGGASLTVYQRSAGEVSEALRVRCYADGSGRLETEASADVAEIPALRVTSYRDGGAARVRFVGGFSDTLAEALACMIDAHAAAATREAERGHAAEAEQFAARAADAARILAAYFKGEGA
jgi:hypothetical protein